VRARCGLPRDAAPAVRLSTLCPTLVDFVVDHADVLAAADVVRRVIAGVGVEPARAAWRAVPGGVSGAGAAA